MAVEVSNSCDICLFRVASTDMQCKGAGNIEPDSQVYETTLSFEYPITNALSCQGMFRNAQSDQELPRYTDGGIVREGHEGDQGDGPFSTGVCSHFRSIVP